jgi:HEAT repeat protein
MILEQLRNQLSAIEPDDSTYEGIGPSEVPLLKELLQDEAWMASRAVFALSRIGDIEAIKTLAQAVADPRPEVKVAIAASVGNLKPENTNDIVLKLLDDEDLGVRKFAVRAITSTHDSVIHSKLRELETNDPSSGIRDIAKDKLRELRLTHI